MHEITITLDALTGNVLVEHPARLPTNLLEQLTDLLGAGRELACALPVELRQPMPATAREIASCTCVRVAGYSHNSLIEGPGRRSTVKFQGCDLRCRGCITPDSWDSTEGVLVTVGRLADVLLDPAFQRDGVSILGGEPFGQPGGLLALVWALRKRTCPHILVYSGYTYEALLRRSREIPAIRDVLNEVDMLIDGPYVEVLVDSAGPWTGSGNQRVIDLAASRQQGHLVCMEPSGAQRSVPQRLHTLHL